jgi:LysM repeat protein
MKTPAKIGTAVSALVVAGLAAIAVPAVASVAQAAAPVVHTAQTALASSTEEPTEAAPAVEPAAATEGTGKCPVWVYPDDVWPFDTGVTEGATGTVVGYDAEGHVATYTVAPNDSPVAIGERFCVDYATLGPLNDRDIVVLHPGEVLNLSPRRP